MHDTSTPKCQSLAQGLVCQGCNLRDHTIHMVGLPSPQTSSVRNQRKHQESGAMISVGFCTLL